MFLSQKSIGVTVSVAVLDLSRFEYTFYAHKITIVELKAKQILNLSVDMQAEKAVLCHTLVGSRVISVCRTSDKRD